MSDQDKETQNNSEKIDKPSKSKKDVTDKGKKPLKVKKQEPQTWDSPSLIVTSSPHISKKDNVKVIMWSVFFTLLPAAIWGIFRFAYDFGISYDPETGTLFEYDSRVFVSDGSAPTAIDWIIGFIKCKAFQHILWSVIFCMLSEAVINYIRKQKLTILDGSAALTGLLLAMTMPYKAPIFVSVISSIFAIIVVKHLFGGLGSNFLNPALGGRVFAMSAWSSIMYSQNSYLLSIDSSSGATPLELMKNYIKANPSATAILKNPMDSYSLSDMFIGNIGGSIGEVSVIFLVIGAVYLYLKKYITWEIPLSYIGTVFVFTLIVGGKDNHFQFAVYHILAGGLFLGALYMATDMVTSPLTSRGQLIFGVGCGVLTVLIRLFGGYPEGVAFSILIMNLFTPLIDRVTKPRIFGHFKDEKLKT